MRPWLAAAAVVVLGVAGCSLLADTSGLVGGPRGTDGGLATDAAADGRPSGGDAGGDARAAGCPATKGPAMVRLDRFCIDATEVTTAQYTEFVTATAGNTTGQGAECAWNTTFAPASCNNDATLRPDHPITGVDWCDAVAYCRWAGKRLCGRIGGGTNPVAEYKSAATSQWFNACSGGGRRVYPHGDTFDSTLCNTGAANRNATVATGSLPGCEGGFPGIFDLSGNAAEWEDSCASSGSPGNDQCRLRGGDFNNTNASNNTCDYDTSDPRDARDCDTGFRCCADL
jgi:formylglycine-generating enzyme required for sulfatase activity